MEGLLKAIWVWGLLLGLSSGGCGSGSAGGSEGGHG